MRMYDIIKKKRDGGTLSGEEINFFIRGYVNGSIPDYQASALCMAIYYRGMSAAETADLTFAIRDSGAGLDHSAIRGVRVDKHSTGGVGDKTSLVVAPIVASLGVRVVKMSGRGLGHTGGTIDKLESINGLRTDIDGPALAAIVNEVGMAIVGQTADLAPADKLLYALRDVTATVDSMPLIASSIMGKKLAADDDGIVLDVKVGSGAFMKTVEESRALAELMVEIGRRAGKQMCALLTDMDRPLGNTIGNSLEVIEAVETLCGRGPADLQEICYALATQMLMLAGKGDEETCRAAARRALESGEALQTFARMVRAQGGDPAWLFHTELFPQAAYTRTVAAPCDGYITHTDAEGYGLAALLLGAGRNTKDDRIDHAAGIRLHAKTGDYVQRGQPLATLYTNEEDRLAAAAAQLLRATEFGAAPPPARPLLYAVIR